MGPRTAEFEALFAARFDVRPLAESGITVRLVAGTRSPAPARRVTELLTRALPRAQRVIVEGGVHMSPVIDPVGLAPHLFYTVALPELARAA